MKREFLLAILATLTVANVATAGLVAYFIFARPTVEVRGIVSGNMEVSNYPYSGPLRVTVVRD